MNNSAMQTLGIQTFGHRVLIKVDEDKPVKCGAIILPDSASKQKLEQYASGIALQVGSTAFSYLIDEITHIDHRPDILNKRVIFKKHAGVHVVKNGGFDTKDAIKYRIVNDEDIMAIFSDFSNFSEEKVAENMEDKK